MLCPCPWFLRPLSWSSEYASSLSSVSFVKVFTWRDVLTGTSFGSFKIPNKNALKVVTSAVVGLVTLRRGPQVISQHSTFTERHLTPRILRRVSNPSNPENLLIAVFSWCLFSLLTRERPLCLTMMSRRSRLNETGISQYKVNTSRNKETVLEFLEAFS